MIPQKQRVVDKGMGDCFAACMASLLELPIEIVPNDHSENWWVTWQSWLGQFGMEVMFHGSKGPIWHSYPWIASVKSKNYKDVHHAIIVDGDSRVLFDPSTAKTYKKGTSLLGKDIIRGGYTLLVKDPTKLHKLQEYREKLPPLTILADDVK